MPDLLLELFSEEIPARMQARAAEDLKKLVTQGMVDRGLTYESAAAFATPRRLTLTVNGMLATTPDVKEERKGPRTDAPETALEGFLRSTGLTKDQLEARDDKKGQVWFAVIEKQGRAASDVLAEVIPDVIRSFPWPRSMRWGSGDLRWVRPLQSIMAILTTEAGAEVIDFEVGGITSGAETFGHRFMAPAAFAPAHFDDYAQRLEAAKVILDPAERRDRIWHDATNVAFAQGLEVVEDQGLLAEVAGLVEWPVVLMGEIDEQFLGLPPEVLQTSMKEHQKFFSVRNPKTGRIEKFVTVANIETPDNGATILAGNQRVLAARLSDALFFWENDLRVAKGEGMEAMAVPLANVTFHNKLGSQAERIARIATLAREIAPLVGADPDKAERAAKIAKADLSSEMVYEFPELQGIMGKYYAEAAGEDAAVAAACETHYSPLGPSDDVPTEPVAVAVSLADKIDILTGFWAIDEKPTGSKDPFALRRAELGRLRIIIETCPNADFSSVLLKHAREMVSVASELKVRSLSKQRDGLTRELLDIRQAPPYDANTQARIEKISLEIDNLGDLLTQINEDTQTDGWLDDEATALVWDLKTFRNSRLKVMLRDSGVSDDVLKAIPELWEKDQLGVPLAKVDSLQKFVETEDGANLLAGYKRAANILAAEQKKDGVEYTLDPDQKFAEDDEEKALFAALDAADAAIRPALEAEDFAAAMTAMAALRAPIDAFFDKVTVNSENSVVRRNRLCLLNRVKTVMERVAVFSAIEG